MVKYSCDEMKWGEWPRYCYVRLGYYWPFDDMSEVGSSPSTWLTVGNCNHGHWKHRPRGSLYDKLCLVWEEEQNTHKGRPHPWSDIWASIEGSEETRHEDIWRRNVRGRENSNANSLGQSDFVGSKTFKRASDRREVCEKKKKKKW